MRVLTWNVAGRVARLPEQVDAVLGVSPDVVALQEVTLRTEPLWRAALEDAGFPSCETALGHAPPVTGRGGRRLAVLTAAREPLERLPGPDDAPWGERVLCCRLGDVEIVNLHSPIAPSAELAKVRTHEAVAAHLARTAGPRILCGDLNTPRRELPDGDVLTFAHTSSGRLREDRGERWDAAERALVHDLRAEHGWVDAFRSLHGYEEREASWTFARDRGGWRLDHILVFALEVVASTYLHDWRRSGLSDHSALLADIQAQML